MKYGSTLQKALCIVVVSLNVRLYVQPNVKTNCRQSNVECYKGSMLLAPRFSFLPNAGWYFEGTVEFLILVANVISYVDIDTRIKECNKR